MNNSYRFTIAIIILFALPVFVNNGNAQIANDCDFKRNRFADNWIFGDNAGVSFNDLSNPQIVDNNYFGPGTERAWGGVSTISDEDGNLLFYTNGMNIWNKSAYIMNNGSGLLGFNGASMSSLIVPSPGNAKQYYVFSVDMYIPNTFTNGINYNIVDFTENAAGKVIHKNLPLMKENAQKICAILHENGKDYWIITHGFGPNNGNLFYVNLLSDTIDVNSQSYSIGVNQTFDLFNTQTYNNGVGYLKASPNGNKIAQVIYHDGVIEVFDFNRSSGVISNAISSTPGDFVGPYGVEFSPDGSKLYVSTTPLNNQINYIYQFDLEQPDPLNNPYEVAVLTMSSATDLLFGALQLSSDGKIYVNKYYEGSEGYNNLGVIYNPDRPGISCNYNSLEGIPDSEFNLGNGNSYFGLPTFPSNLLNTPPFWSINRCLNDTTHFKIRNTSNLDPTWDFKDPQGTDILTDPYNPGFVFSQAGTYSVEMTESYNGVTYNIHTEDVVINPLPAIDIGAGSDIIYILPGSSIRLDAGDGFDIYSWNTGGTTQFLDVADTGEYIATVTDFNCCTNSDTVRIKYASLSYPNAFTPEGINIVNQTFKVIGNVGAISKYQFRIFNRWGQMIFETDDPLEGWDGTKDGSPAPIGTYVYSSVFTSFESGIQSSIDIKNTGTVTLIR